MRKSFPKAELDAAVGATPVQWGPVVGSGYGTNTKRWLIELEGGQSVFVKLALDEMAAEWLRNEHRIYASVEGSFMPALAGWHDEDGCTFLAIEDLRDLYWPPPWLRGQIDAVLAALDELHATAAPAGTPSLEDARDRLEGWTVIADDPEPFLSTGLASREWLEAALPELIAASTGCELAGASLVHLDVRSDNLCLRGSQPLFVDWNHAHVGNPLIDVVEWLPSLKLEGGPDPWELVPESSGLAAFLAGVFVSRAGLPPPATAPRVREFQRRQGEVALEWTARELALPPPRLSA